jgi:hypothetical protein
MKMLWVTEDERKGSSWGSSWLRNDSLADWWGDGTAALRYWNSRNLKEEEEGKMNLVAQISKTRE